MFSPSLSRYYRTLKHYRLSQLFYKLYFDYFKKSQIKNYKYTKRLYYPDKKNLNLKLEEKRNNFNIELINNKVKISILNFHISTSVTDLWKIDYLPEMINFNINYMQFLSSSLDLETKISLLDSNIEFCKSKNNIFTYDPAVISIKLIEIIRFLEENSIRNNEYTCYIFDQAEFLTSRLEKELLANHYLLNGFCLLYLAYYFRDINYLNKANYILENQIKEQFLNDGMHFELSPMYHAIITHYLLYCYELIDNNYWEECKLKELIGETLSRAISFYKFISIDDYYPCFNDSYFDENIRYSSLQKYFNRFSLPIKKINQGLESGYRKYKTENLNMIFDAGQIGAKYQPAHSHADNFTFCLYFNKQPIIVDTGTSTYKNNNRRKLERSTQSHNTIMIDYIDSSEVWEKFRVGRIARTFIDKDNHDFIKVYHDGYKFLGILHKREIQINNNKIQISDELSCNKDKKSKSFLHFHPNAEILKEKKYLLINKKIKITWNGFEKIELVPYSFAKNFNQLEDSVKFVGIFSNKSRIIISEI